MVKNNKLSNKAKMNFQSPTPSRQSAQPSTPVPASISSPAQPRLAPDSTVRNDTIPKEEAPGLTMSSFLNGESRSSEELSFVDRSAQKDLYDEFERFEKNVKQHFDAAVERLHHGESSDEPATPTPPSSTKPDSVYSNFSQYAGMTKRSPFDAAVDRLQNESSVDPVNWSLETWTKHKVPSVPSSSPSHPYAGVRKRGPTKRELEGYLPTMSSLTRAPLTALKEVRAELQKRFPMDPGFAAEGVADNHPKFMDAGLAAEGLADTSNGKEKTGAEDKQTLFSQFEATVARTNENIGILENLNAMKWNLFQLCSNMEMQDIMLDQQGSQVKEVLKEGHETAAAIKAQQELYEALKKRGVAQLPSEGVSAASLVFVGAQLEWRKAIEEQATGWLLTELTCEALRTQRKLRKALEEQAQGEMTSEDIKAAIRAVRAEQEQLEKHEKLAAPQSQQGKISETTEADRGFELALRKSMENAGVPQSKHEEILSNQREFRKLSEETMVALRGVKAQQQRLEKQAIARPKPRALPFAANSEFQNPESFAELNNRLKTGSRLSAIISTSLENKTDFRARWGSLNTALPRDVNAQDFVKLVTPSSSPTKPSACTPAAPSAKGESTSGISLPSPAGGESLTDYYNKRFESLGAEAKELIKKAHRTLMNPVVQAKESFDPADYTKPFCDFLTENPTIFHAVDHLATKLKEAGFEKLSERDLWNSKLKAGGKYFVERNGSSLIAFSVGKAYKSGNGVAMIAGHVDALAARLKPVSTKKTKAGYVQLGVAPYAGALNATWFDRDLGVGGRVLVKDGKSGKITSKLVKLGWPIARIPTLAPHFGVGMMGSNNAETQAVPIIGLDNSDLSSISKEEDAAWKASSLLGGEGTFAATQPPKLLKAIAGELNIQNYNSIVNWELELFDTQPAQVGGLEKEFIFAGRVDDKLCSWSAMEALLEVASSDEYPENSGIINLVGVFDDEEIGSLLRQGAKGNFLPSVIERISEAFSESGASSNVLSQTYANSFLISADVTHAVNPNFLENYLENHSPRLNVGVVVSADSNGHMTTDSVSTALMQQIAEKCGSVLQLFMIRNDSRSGGTVGPMLSSAMGVRAIDMGIPQLSMHSIRATTGSLDPGLGVKLFKGFFEHFEAVDKEFE